MDVFYEESAVNQNAERGRKIYKVLNIVSWIFIILCLIFAFCTIMLIPSCKDRYEADYGFHLFNCLFMLGFALMFFFGWFIFYQLKKRVNISFDYIFVSGELRIAKIFNVNRRKLVERISCEEMIQIGDTDNPSYDRLASSPDTKVVYYTQNMEAADGKFFMYILLAASNGKRLLVLEARELLLMNIMKFARRNVLESDYVMQEKKLQQKL